MLEEECKTAGLGWSGNDVAFCLSVTLLRIKTGRCKNTDLLLQN